MSRPNLRNHSLRKEPVELPAHVVQHIFGICTGQEDHEPILDLKQRVRCLAVCRAWRKALDPRTVPVERCRLEAVYTERRDSVVQYVCAAQPTVHALSILICDGLGFDTPSVETVHCALLSLHPRAALHSLRLEAPYQVARRFWWPLRCFPALRHLDLYHDSRQPEASLDGGMLSPLRCLEDLRVEAWGMVALVAGPGGLSRGVGGAGASGGGAAQLLPQLTRLRVLYCERMEVDAALPRLQALELSDVDEMRLSGGWLQLPALERLRMVGCDSSASLDFSRMPALVGLSMERVDSLTANGTLPALTSLHVGYHHAQVSPDWEAALALLRLAPPSLQCLAIRHGAGPCAALPQLGRFLRLTRLVCTSAEVIPLLHPLHSHLRELHLPFTSPSHLSIEHLERLADLPALRLLSFGLGYLPDSKDDAQRLRLQVLKRALPDGCVVQRRMTRL